MSINTPSHTFSEAVAAQAVAAQVKTLPGTALLPETTPVRLVFRCYSRPFVQALQTAHGPWRDRQGIILQLSTASGRTGHGEIAPIPWFGTETLAEAIAILTELQAAERILTLGDLSTAMEKLPARYSATRFGLGLAIALLQDTFPPSPPAPQPQQICALLPTGLAALQAWPELWRQGHRTFKWKIGVAEIEQECSGLRDLRRSLPAQAKLRLDANGGFSLAAAQVLLRCCDDLAMEGFPIEFVEQPLSPSQFDELLVLGRTYQTALALDESVTGLAQLQTCYEGGWRGIFVVKGAIAGDPQAVIHYCRRHRLKLVFSSVFETDLARQAVFAMAQAIQAPAAGGGDNDQGNGGWSNVWSNSHESNGCESNGLESNSYALGFGVDHWLQPNGLNLPDRVDDGAEEQPSRPMTTHERGSVLWQQLSTC